MDDNNDTNRKMKNISNNGTLKSGESPPPLPPLPDLRKLRKKRKKKALRKRNRSSDPPPLPPCPQDVVDRVRAKHPIMLKKISDSSFTSATTESSSFSSFRSTDSTAQSSNERSSTVAEPTRIKTSETTDKETIIFYAMQRRRSELNDEDDMEDKTDDLPTPRDVQSTDAASEPAQSFHSDSIIKLQMGSVLNDITETKLTRLRRLREKREISPRKPSPRPGDIRVSLMNMIQNLQDTITSHNMTEMPNQSSSWDEISEISDDSEFRQVAEGVSSKPTARGESRIRSPRSPLSTVRTESIHVITTSSNEENYIKSPRSPGGNPRTESVHVYSVMTSSNEEENLIQSHRPHVDTPRTKSTQLHSPRITSNEEGYRNQSPRSPLETSRTKSIHLHALETTSNEEGNQIQSPVVTKRAESMHVHSITSTSNRDNHVLSPRSPEGKSLLNDVKCIRSPRSRITTPGNVIHVEHVIGNTSVGFDVPPASIPEKGIQEIWTPPVSHAWTHNEEKQADDVNPPDSAVSQIITTAKSTTFEEDILVSQVQDPHRHVSTSTILSLDNSIASDSTPLPLDLVSEIHEFKIRDDNETVHLDHQSNPSYSLPKTNDMPLDRPLVTKDIDTTPLTNNTFRRTSTDTPHRVITTAKRIPPRPKITPTIAISRNAITMENSVVPEYRNQSDMEISNCPVPQEEPMVSDTCAKASDSAWSTVSKMYQAAANVVDTKLPERRDGTAQQNISVPSKWAGTLEKYKALRQRIMVDQDPETAKQMIPGIVKFEIHKASIKMQQTENIVQNNVALIQRMHASQSQQTIENEVRALNIQSSEHDKSFETLKKTLESKTQHLANKLADMWKRRITDTTAEHQTEYELIRKRCKEMHRDWRFRTDSKYNVTLSPMLRKYENEQSHWESAIADVEHQVARLEKRIAILAKGQSGVECTYGMSVDECLKRFRQVEIEKHKRRVARDQRRIHEALCKLKDLGMHDEKRAYEMLLLLDLEKCIPCQENIVAVYRNMVSQIHSALPILTVLKERQMLERSVNACENAMGDARGNDAPAMRKMLQRERQAYDEITIRAAALMQEWESVYRTKFVY